MLVQPVHVGCEAEDIASKAAKRHHSTFISYYLRRQVFLRLSSPDTRPSPLTTSAQFSSRQDFILYPIPRGRHNSTLYSVHPHAVGRARGCWILVQKLTAVGFGRCNLHCMHCRLQSCMHSVCTLVGCMQVDCMHSRLQSGGSACIRGHALHLVFCEAYYIRIKIRCQIPQLGFSPVSVFRYAKRLICDSRVHARGRIPIKIWNR